MLINCPKMFLLTKSRCLTGGFLRHLLFFLIMQQNCCLYKTGGFVFTFFVVFVLTLFLLLCVYSLCFSIYLLLGFHSLCLFCCFQFLSLSVYLLFPLSFFFCLFVIDVSLSFFVYCFGAFTHFVSCLPCVCNFLCLSVCLLLLLF